MQDITKLLAIITIAFTMVGCSIPQVITRTETDVYTITKTDTTKADIVNNAPGERNNGAIFPSTRTLVVSRDMIQYDSVESRHYPNFIRLGLFESVGLIGSNYDGAGFVNRGLFGAHPSIANLFGRTKESSGSGVFAGGMYRIGIYENRLRLFNDNNWTYGVTALEVIQPDSNTDHTLVGAAVFTIHKRFYLKNSIPYLAITPQITLSLFGPSYYANLAASADLGSIAGLNLRFYGGFVYGVTTSGKSGAAFPYLGFGASVLDFLNKEEELETEWKYHEHSGWQIGLAEFSIVGSNQDISVFSRTSDPNQQPVIKGMIARIAPTTVALPFLDHRLSIGTSLVSLVALGDRAFGIGVLPARVSYTIHPTGKGIQLTPFLEYSYAISDFVHLGAKISAPITSDINLHLTAGYASGNLGANSGFSFSNENTGSTSFSGFYIGFGASVFDRLFNPDELRYGKGYPHE